jgi:predicted dehydrogenase
MTRIGIIGTGDVAHTHIIGFLTSNIYEITGCYSPENRQSMIFARQYRLISYSTAEALFKYADAVDITDDFPETMKLAELSLRALKHVFIARPDSLKMKQMQYLKQLADESGVVLQLGTGYKYCPAYHILADTMQAAMVVDIKHQFLNNSDLYTQLNMKLCYDFDFVTNIMNASISKLDVKTWTKSENSPDMLHCSPDVLHCRIECDNGCAVNLMAYTVVEGEPKLEMNFTSSDAVIRADIFKSHIEKLYRSCNVTDRITLDAYNEKTIQQDYLRNFYRAICNHHDAIRNIDKQFQNLAAADYIVEKIK